MKAFVDKELCIGCGLCCTYGDEVFRLNEDGKSEAYKDVNENNLIKVQEAIDNCPVSAISMEE